MKLLIGIDDTDNKESRGTGFLSRQLGKLIQDRDLGIVGGITRHQLFVHSSIAYTSQNSSACLEVETDNLEDLITFCADYLKRESAVGSDAGLCVAKKEYIIEKIFEWGQRAKTEVLELDDAIRLAKEENIYLKGFTGTFIGQIGALAAVGLRAGGNDGRFIWLSGTGELRDFDSGIFSVYVLMQKTGIKALRTTDGTLPNTGDRIFCDGWTRPILSNNIPVLLVEKVNFVDYEWKTISKDYIRENH